jgi:D-aminopeptidase
MLLQDRLRSCAIALANALNLLLQHPEQLAIAKTTVFKAAITLSWEQQKDKLLQAVDRALKNNPSKLAH